MPNNCRKTKSGKYEAYVCNKKIIYLGTYTNENEAKEKIINYRINIFVKSVEEYNLNPNDCKIFEDTYLVFPTGEIFNCYGKKIVGDINRDGYIVGTLNKKFYQFHRVVALCFCLNLKAKILLIIKMEISKIIMLIILSGVPKAKIRHILM